MHSYHTSTIINERNKDIHVYVHTGGYVGQLSLLTFLGFF